MFNYFKIYSWNLALSMALDAGLCDVALIA